MLWGKSHAGRGWWTKSLAAAWSPLPLACLGWLLFKPFKPRRLWQRLAAKTLTKARKTTAIWITFWMAVQILHVLLNDPTNANTCWPTIYMYTSAQRWQTYKCSIGQTVGKWRCFSHRANVEDVGPTLGQRPRRRQLFLPGRGTLFFPSGQRRGRWANIGPMFRRRQLFLPGWVR